MSSAPDVENDDHELRLLIQKLSRRIRAERSPGDLSDTYLRVLGELALDGPMTPGALADRERVSPPSINRTLNALEAEGRITREPDPDDGRRVIVRITEAGREIARETRRIRDAWFDARLAELEPAERAALRAAAPALRKLADS